MMLDILLEAALRATVIAAVVLGALWSLRVRTADVRHRTWTVVMLAMLVLPLAIAFAPDVALQIPNASGAIANPPAAGDAALAPVEPATGVATQAAPTAPWNWRAWLIAVYFSGAAVLLARLAIGTVRVRSLAREATVVDGVLTSARIATPFTFGWAAPKILLPEGWQRWSATQLAIVLDHERTHVARRDPLVQWLALLNRAVFWFHPLAWWLERHLATLAEEACDAEVLARGHNAADYSQQLLALARLAARRPMPQFVRAPMPGSALPARIAKILDGGVERPASRVAVGSAAALATVAAAMLGTVTLAQETSSPKNLLEVYEAALANDPAVRDDAARQELLLRIAEPYFDALAAERELALQESARATFSRQLEVAQRRFEVGLIPLTDVQVLQGDFDRASANAMTAQAALVAAQEALRTVVGEPVGQLKPLVENLALEPPVPANAEQWIETARQRDAAPQQAESAVRAAYLGVISEISRGLALRQAVQSSETAVEATRAAFDVGTRSSVDVVRAENDLRQSQTAYALSRDAYALNVLRLHGAAGDLTSQRLDDLSRWFE
jgi:beta-lactamase regulating signal transducer with metallopeptidase domain